MKGEWVSAADWRYQINSHKNVILHVRTHDFPQGWKSLQNTAVYIIKQCSRSSLALKCTGRSFFSLHLVCTTVAPWTFRWCNKTVNVIRPTVDHRDVQYESATAIGQLGKADPSGNFTVLHWRMVVIQPAWKNCITSMPTNAFVWHSCSCCSHETIPSPESTVTWHFIEDCDVRAPSVGITQDFVINTWVDYKIKW